jgi:PHD/YefM family antitoxin component YafN of YafNO toxin-antitoxin module
MMWQAIGGSGQAMVTGQAPEEGALHMAKSMEVVPSGELQKQFGRYSDEAMIRPVGVSRNGRVRFVMVPVDEYERLRRRERVAGRVEDLDDETLEAIRAVEPGRGSEAAEERLNAS